MRSRHLLNLGNARKVKENLSGILDTAALDSIEAEIEANVAGLLTLALRHYRFADRQSAPNWRQRISRLYYAAYNAARAVRLYVSGEYSTDVKDHQKFDKLPEDFPNRASYVNQLEVLREDRNTCDYDHISTASDLALGSGDSTALVHDFLRDVRAYLRDRGMSL
jgi:hypothetical protein